MQHRGPDSNGVWQNKNYITGFVRLAIRDVSASGSQPMISSCGKYCLTFNGEIYNADNFRNALIAKGVAFKSTTDTEVLLYALIHFELDFVLQNFDGMYAFAFYSVENNQLIIARDRLGIKPLYLGFNATNDIIFSSQYNHIINYEDIANEDIDASVVASYLQLGYVADGLGIVHNTQMLPHGHYVVINNNGYTIHQYYNVIHSNTTTEVNVLTENKISESVQSQLISDVPVASFLSGGVDSSLVTLLANKNKPITAFTISTGEVETDEKDKATWFTNKFSIPHVVKSIDTTEFQKIVDQHTKAYTEPFADFSSIPSLLISQVAAQEVKVVLSGDGPDELFWGYNRNIKMIELIKKFYRSKAINISEYLLSKINLAQKKISKQFLKAETFADFYFNSMFIYGSAIWQKKIFPVNPAEVYFNTLIKSQKVANTLDNAMHTIWNYEMNIHLQRILLKMDRASMYHSLEARVPYLSNELLSFASNTNWKQCIQNKIGKKNIKEILAAYTGDEFAYAHKKGFDIPIHSWINGALQNTLQDAFMNMPSELKQYFDVNELDKMLQKHFANEEKNGNMIWAVYVLINWYNEHRNSYKKYTA